jgi:hypothetical protein
VSYYVYKLVDPRDGKPFYVGKGKGRRCFSHEMEARRGVVGPKCDKIREIIAAGRGVEFIRVKEFKVESQAYAYERELIHEIGIENLTNSWPGKPGLSPKIREMISTVASLARLIRRNEGRVVLRQPKPNSSDMMDTMLRVLSSLVFAIGSDRTREELKKQQVIIPEDAIVLETAT